MPLNPNAASHARKLLAEGKLDRDSKWSFTAADGDGLLGAGKDWASYSRFHLWRAPDADVNKASGQKKSAYKYPYGKAGRVFREGLAAAQREAGKNNERLIEEDAGRLLALVDASERNALSGSEPFNVLQSGGADAIDAIVSNVVQNEDGTVEFDGVAHSGATMFRGGFFGHFLMRMEMAPENVRMGRMESGRANLLNAHNSARIEDIIGIIPTAELSDGRILFHGKVTNAADAQPVRERLLDGTLRNVSIGFNPYKAALEPGTNGALDLVRVVDWEPYEVSPLGVGADPGAGLSMIQETAGASPITEQPQEGQEMAEKPAGDTSAITTPAPAVDETKLRQQVAQEERARIQGIDTLCATHRIEPALRQGMIDDGLSVLAAGAKVLDVLSAAQTRTPTSGAITVNPVFSAQDRRAAMVSAIVERMRPTGKLDDAARQFAGMRLWQFAGACLETPGVRETPDETVRLALTTSDFPYVLSDVAHIRLRAAYEAAPPTYRALCHKMIFSDFREHHLVETGAFPDLLEVGENAEIKYGAIGEGKETVRLATYARAFVITRHVIVNDSLGVFDRMVEKVGQRVSALENRLFFDLLKSNTGTGPAMNDTYKMIDRVHHFNAPTSGAVVSNDTIGAGIAAMKAQKSIPSEDGEDDGLILNIVPRFLLTSPEYNPTARALMQVVAATEAAKINIWAGELSPISDGNLTGKPWWLFGDSAYVYGYLEGQDGPYTETQQGFVVDGVALKARLDFGIGADDWKAIYRNPGQ